MSNNIEQPNDMQPQKKDEGIFNRELVEIASRFTFTGETEQTADGPKWAGIVSDGTTEVRVVCSMPTGIRGRVDIPDDVIKDLPQGYNFNKKNVFIIELLKRAGAVDEKGNLKTTSIDFKEASESRDNIVSSGDIFASGYK